MKEHTQEDFYTAEPVWKKVLWDEAKEFIDKYPRPLEKDVCGIAEPPAVSFNDFALADYWPWSIVVSGHLWDAYHDVPYEEQYWDIMVNHEEVFNSKVR